MEQRIIDLHVHSTESDGTFTPQEVIHAAKDAGLSALALTDHDTVSGVSKARPIAEELGIELIPGIELSTDYQGKEVHVVGLFVDDSNPLLLEKTAEYRACRDQRNVEMVKALQKEGLAITMEELLAENQDCVVTRANIARFLLDHGQVKSIREAFDKYIGDGCKCYVGRFKITPMEGISLIKQANGLAILAHPILYHMSTVRLQQLVCDCKSTGLDGIEAIYSTYTTGEEHLMRKLAKENGLVISGGSDFHGDNKPLIKLGTGMGHLYIPYSVLETLKDLRSHR